MNTIKQIGSLEVIKIDRLGSLLRRFKSRISSFVCCSIFRRSFVYFKANNLYVPYHLYKADRLFFERMAWQQRTRRENIVNMPSVGSVPQ